jgi:Protein of unknown function (DUF1573)
MKTPLIAAGMLLLCTLPLRASLTWENKEADLHPSITDKEAVAHFKYKNTGEQPVKIMTVKPSCGCTTAAPPNEPVAPGASGEITATFHIGDRVGPQTKTIHVTTDEPGDQVTTLTLKADVPKLLEVTPMFLYWSKAQPITPRSITAKIGGDFPITKLDVTSTDPEIKVEAKPVPNEKAFEITVTPKQTNRPMNAMLKIQPDFPKGSPKLFYANVRVDAHPENAPAASAAATASGAPSATPATP